MDHCKAKHGKEARRRYSLVLSGVEIKSISPDHDWKALADQPDSSNNMIFMKQNGKLYGSRL